MARLNLASIPPHRPFLDALAAHWLTRSGEDPLACAAGLILLPTNRAARNLREAFLRRSEGRGLLLPRIGVIGGLDETGLALEGALSLPPSVERYRRLAILTGLVMRMGGADGQPHAADRAWPLASELAMLLDEAARAEIDLAARLPDAADSGFAEHWRRTLTFLRIVTVAWPEWLRDNGLMDIGARQVALLDAQSAAWAARPPAEPVLVAGVSGAIPAAARLMKVVAGSPNGLVVLPGLDRAMPPEHWAALEPGHPQSGLSRLLAAIGAVRDDVAEWREESPAEKSGEPPRSALFRRAMLPAAALEDWRAGQPPPPAAGLWRLRPEDQQDEAVAIAAALRDALQRPDRRAALVTPDRELAVRVSAELMRFGVLADDSAGEALAQTPPGAFLRLLAAAPFEAFAPAPILALLKHPLCAAGLSPSACRRAARRLELACLRGPRPAPGLDGLRAALRPRDAREPPNGAEPTAPALLDQLEQRLAPLLELAGRAEARPDQALSALLTAAESLAASDVEPGQDRLWRHEDGAALAALLGEAREALALLPPQPPSILPSLLDELLTGERTHTRRALRGREDRREHPRVFIWGLREAQLQHAELMVLGGLAEGVWPPATDPGPWMSRPMRHAVGLSSPEERVGLMAHDVTMAACGSDEVILSCPRRRDGAPAVPSRWLSRIDAFLHGWGQALPTHPAGAWAALLDRPKDAPCPVSPPAPRPPVARRPRQLTVTEVETWLRDPYAIHARHILRLRPLPPIDEPTDAADYGSIVHEGIAAFLREGARMDEGSARGAGPGLRAALERALDRAGMRPALAAWWRPRLRRIADWVTEEAERRLADGPASIHPEVSGRLELPGPAGVFTLRGRADRIERRADGRLAILDYKTGLAPGAAQVEAGFAPQLPLEAMMAEAGAFGPALRGATGELTYWRLSGGFVAGEAKRLFKDAASVEAAMHAARDRLCALMRAYDDPERAYLSQPHPGAAPRFSTYAQLARVAEWMAAEEG